MPGGPYRVGRPEHNPGDPLPGSPRMAIGRTSFLARTARLIIASGRSSAGRWSPLHTEKTGQPRIPDEADRAAGSNLGVVSYLLERPRPPVASDSGRKSARKVHRMFGPPPPAASRRLPPRTPSHRHPPRRRPPAGGPQRSAITYATQPAQTSPRLVGRKIPLPSPCSSVPSQYTVLRQKPASARSSRISAIDQRRQS